MTFMIFIKTDFKKFNIIKNIILLIENEIHIKVLYLKSYLNDKNYKISLWFFQSWNNVWNYKKII